MGGANNCQSIIHQFLGGCNSLQFQSQFDFALNLNLFCDPWESLTRFCVEKLPRPKVVEELLIIILLNFPAAIVLQKGNSKPPFPMERGGSGEPEFGNAAITRYQDEHAGGRGVGGRGEAGEPVFRNAKITIYRDTEIYDMRLRK